MPCRQSFLSFPYFCLLWCAGNSTVLCCNSLCSLNFGCPPYWRSFFFMLDTIIMPVITFLDTQKVIVQHFSFIILYSHCVQPNKKKSVKQLSDDLTATLKHCKHGSFDASERLCLPMCNKFPQDGHKY